MNIDPLIYFINERHRIYLKRVYQHQDPPWTRDPILQTYRFCNVFRELDTTTEWIRINWRQPWAEARELWFWMVVARTFNYIPTLRALNEFGPGQWNPKRVTKRLKEKQEAGEKIYTSAYMLYAPNIPGKGKIDYHVGVLDSVWKKRADFEEFFGEHNQCQRSLQTVSDWLQQFSGIGAFMAYEMVTDLRHTRYLKDAPDINTWANAGPGAIRGLNRLLGRPLKSKMKQEEALHHMIGLLDTVNRHKGIHVPPLELRDIEHSLCETDKYLRVKLGEGRPREKFTASQQTSKESR